MIIIKRQTNLDTGALIYTGELPELDGESYKRLPYSVQVNSLGDSTKEEVENKVESLFKQKLIKNLSSGLVLKYLYWLSVVYNIPVSKLQLEVMDIEKELKKLIKFRFED